MRRLPIQGRAQQHARTVQLGLAAARRDAELFADLFMRKAFHVM
jgi:outer membrane PBP1 activator LpoA protein